VSTTNRLLWARAARLAANAADEAPHSRSRLGAALQIMDARERRAGSAAMPEPSNVKLDHGAINQRILAKENAGDYRRVEQASVKQRTRFESPEAKRLYARYFHSLQLNAHFISEIARIRLEPEQVEKVEQMMRSRLERLAQEIDGAIDGAALLLEREGVTTTATYDAQALDLEVGVISSFGRRYLEALLKLDRLMPMLRTLEIYEVITTSEADKRRALYKKQVRGVAMGVRILAGGLRKRMNESALKEEGKGEVRGERRTAGRAKSHEVPAAGDEEQAAPAIDVPQEAPVQVAAE
jgi:hypothetical protein